METEEAHGQPTVGSVGLAVLSFSPYLTPASFWITFKSPETGCFMVSHHWKPVPAIQDAGFLLLLSLSMNLQENFLSTPSCCSEFHHLNL